MNTTITMLILAVLVILGIVGMLLRTLLRTVITSETLWIDASGSALQSQWMPIVRQHFRWMQNVVNASAAGHGRLRIIPFDHKIREPIIIMITSRTTEYEVAQKLKEIRSYGGSDYKQVLEAINTDEMTADRHCIVGDFMAPSPSFHEEITPETNGNLADRLWLAPTAYADKQEMYRFIEALSAIAPLLGSRISSAPEGDENKESLS